MAVPVITQLTPTTGPTSGGGLVRIVGSNFGSNVEVRFGGEIATIVSVRVEAGSSVCDLRTPSHETGTVDVVFKNLDSNGTAIPGESTTLVGGYQFAGAVVARESDLTRLIRTLLRELKKQVISNVSTSVSVDYDDSTADGLRIIAMASLPALVLSGPTLHLNRFFSTNEAFEAVISGISGPEVVRSRPSYTVDLTFTITAASERTAELLNLMASVATFLNRNRWIEMLRDPADSSRGSVRWEMDADGDFQTQLSGRDDVRGFTCGLIIRGFDVDEGLPMDFGKAVDEIDLESTSVLGP